MSDQGDELLYALSAWGETSWPRFVQAFDAILGASPPARGDLVAVERWKAVTVLSSLGHVDLVPVERLLVVAPPVIAQLPTPGLVRAVVCGRRSPTTLKELREAARLTGAEIQVIATRQASRSLYAPIRIEISAVDSGTIRAVADRMGITYAETPPAWGLAEVSGSVHEYVEHLAWLDEDELNWERSDFSADRVRMGPPVASVDGFRLSRYRNPVTGQGLVRLRRGSQVADADIDWGRFVVLMAAKRRVIEYDLLSLTVGVSLGAPLPRLLARALALCSGEAPAAESADGAHGGRQLFYRGVSPEVANAVATKLGQEDE